MSAAFSSARARRWLAGAMLLGVGLLAPLLAGRAVHGQAFGQLEKRLQSEPATAPAADAAAAPGTGYLGAVLDEPAEPGQGVRVNSVREGGPAAQGKLQANDLITAIDGKPVTGLPDLDAVLDRAVPGQTIRLTVRRGTQPQTVSIRLGTRPVAPAAEPGGLAPEPAGATPPASLPSLQPPGGSFTIPATPAPSIGAPSTGAPSTGAPALSSPESLTLPRTASPPEATTPPAASAPGAAEPDSLVPPAQPLDLGPPPGSSPPPATMPESRTAGPAAGGGGPSLGVTVVPLTEEARLTSGVPTSRGALVTQVKPGSPAAQAGLPVGAVIVTADGRRIDSADDLVSVVRAARPGQELELRFYEGNRLRQANVRLGGTGAGEPIAAAPGGPGGATFAPPGSLPGGSAGRLGAGGGRPLLNRVERMVDGLSRGAIPPAAPTTTSTVYDPLVMAALQQRVEELSATVNALQQRLTALEARLGGSAPAATPAGGLGAPGTGATGTPAITPP